MARTKRARAIEPTCRANNVALGPGASQLTAAPANAAAAGGQCPLLELFSDELLLQCTSFLSHADDLARLECTCRRFAAKTIVCAADPLLLTLLLTEVVLDTSQEGVYRGKDPLIDR